LKKLLLLQIITLIVSCTYASTVEDSLKQVIIDQEKKGDLPKVVETQFALFEYYFKNESLDLGKEILIDIEGGLNMTIKSKGLIEDYINLAQKYGIYYNNIDKAIVVLKEGLQASKELNDSIQIAKVYNGLGYKKNMKKQTVF